MIMAVFKYLRAAAVAFAGLQVALAQQCYYPNGAEAPDTEKPCSSAEGTACCPENWQCMDNGLCYLPADKLYGRYSCTDKDWKSSGCPSNMCIYDVSAGGGEDVTQCSAHDNKWCCNGDRTHVNCCKESPSPRPFFALQDPVAYGTIGGKTGSSAPNLATITVKASDGGSDSPSSTAASNSASATKGSSSSDKASSTGPTASVTSVSTTVSSGSAGPTTIVTTIVQPAASSTNDPSPSATPEKKSKVPIIVGCAVGVPLALALIGILTWLLRKRAHQKSQAPPYTSSTDAFTPTPATPEFAGGAKLHKPNSATKYASADPGVPELGGGQGVGPERPISMIPGKAEMDSGGGFAPGVAPQAPHLVGVGGGNRTTNGAGAGHTPQSSWGSAPPGYSPAQAQGGWIPTGVDPNAGRYQAYRPGINNVPEMAELPSVTTPPEVAEMGNPSPPVAGARAEYPGMAEAGVQRR